MSKIPPHGTYRIEVISLPEEIDDQKNLPLELQYIFSVAPEKRAVLREILANGKAIGIRTITHTPENILKAIQFVSETTQHNCVLTWLTPFLRDNHQPIFTTQEDNPKLHEALQEIRHARLSFKKCVLIDEDNLGISDSERRLMTELSEIIYPLAIDTIVNRTILDNANERTEIAQSIIKTMFIIGPIAHVLEKFASGIGKVFAASTDDLLGEAAEIMALRGSGFGWNVLKKRFMVLIPVFGLATFGAFRVEHFLEKGQVILAGVVFGVSAVALSLTTAIQSIGMYHHSIKQLRLEKKLRTDVKNRSPWVEAIIQDFTNPARLGLLIGAAMAPIMGIAAAVSGLMHNGWVLAGVGATESIVAGITVMTSSRLNEWRFKHQLQKRIK
jgi:hypothetical protein